MFSTATFFLINSAKRKLAQNWIVLILLVILLCSYTTALNQNKTILLVFRTTTPIHAQFLQHITNCLVEIYIYRNKRVLISPDP